MKSFLDQDIYNFNVQQAIFDHYRDTEVSYKFIDRNKTKIQNPFSFLSKLKDRIDQIASVSIASHEVRYLEKTGNYQFEYLAWLKQHSQLKASDVSTQIVDGVLEMEINGSWLRNISWEVPLLAAATGLYLDDTPSNIDKQYHCLQEKVSQLQGLNFCEFGTRRRRNFEYQQLAVNVLKNNRSFLGTSNAYLAMLHDVNCVGTMSHQWIMGVSAAHGVSNANNIALNQWVQTYQGRLGVALTDTFGTENFLESFDGVKSRIFDGVRQDSADEVKFGNRITNHYKSLGINPAHKKVLFSNGLNPVKCQKIDLELDSPLSRVYCIGTDFTNDQKVNLVIKLDKVNGKSVVKLSDDITKATGNAVEVAAVKKELNYV